MIAEFHFGASISGPDVVFIVTLSWIAGILENRAISIVISNTCVFPTVMNENACCEKSLFSSKDEYTSEETGK